MKIDFNAAAVMFWLPEGEMPKQDDFRVDADHRPPSPNPHGYWTLGSALLESKRLQGDFDKRPWIKTGGAVLSPVQVIKAYEAFKNGKEFHA